MIELHGISKIYSVRGGRHVVLDGIDFTISPGEKIGILGRNGSGKSTLIRILSGAERPTRGYIRREMKLSWPLAFGGAFQGSLSGLDNVKFICRVYGVDYKEKVEYIQDFSELGKYLREPIRSYSSGMRSRLAFAISMAVDFDCYLIDEIISVGDARFQAKCQVELFEKRSHRSFLMTSHDTRIIREHCSKIGVLHEGKMKMFYDIDEAYQYYNGVINRSAS